MLRRIGCGEDFKEEAIHSCGCLRGTYLRPKKVTGVVLVVVVGSV